MITFEEAKELEPGDVFFTKHYVRYVIAVTVDEITQTATITYTDDGGGGDQFDIRNDDPSISLTPSDD